LFSLFLSLSLFVSFFSFCGFECYDFVHLKSSKRKWENKEKKVWISFVFVLRWINQWMISELNMCLWPLWLFFFSWKTSKWKNNQLRTWSSTFCILFIYLILLSNWFKWVLFAYLMKDWIFLSLSFSYVSLCI
jgi:hypothetical protein